MLRDGLMLCCAILRRICGRLVFRLAERGVLSYASSNMIVKRRPSSAATSLRDISPSSAISFRVRSQAQDVLGAVDANCRILASGISLSAVLRRHVREVLGRASAELHLVRLPGDRKGLAQARLEPLGDNCGGDASQDYVCTEKHLSALIVSNRVP